MSKQPHINSYQWIHDQAALMAALPFFESGNAAPKGTVRGTIKSVNDPKNLGRVLVLFDKDNVQWPQVTGAGKWSEPRPGDEENLSHWLDVSPAFKGRQPPGLVGKRVSISVTDGEYQYAVVDGAGCLFDPQNFTEKAGSKMTMPDNSTMTRLPLYPSGQLPPAGKENHGCTVVELNGQMDADWVCVCLRRRGKYLWVRHVDLQHGHAGENDGQQPPDSHPDTEEPVNEQSVWDYVFPTSDQAMPKSSNYGTSPRPNPFGGQATWNSPPK